MAIIDLESLAKAYYDPTDKTPQMIVLGQHLPGRQHSHPASWNAILNLGYHQGSEVMYYAPRQWEFVDNKKGESSYVLNYEGEVTIDNDHVSFTRTIPEGAIDRIIFLNPSNENNSIPNGAEIFTDNGILEANSVAR